MPVQPAAREPNRRPSLQPPMQRKTATIQEATCMTGLGATTINCLIKRGELRSAKVGRRRLVFIDSLDALLARTTDHPRAFTAEEI